MMTKEEYQKTLIRMWDSVRDDFKGKDSCDGIECDKCPIKFGCGKSMNYYDVVKFVEKWAEEHPIKTNREVFMEAVQEKFGDTLNIGSLNRMLEPSCELVNVDCTNRNCKTCKYRNFWNDEYKESK